MASYDSEHSFLYLNLIILEYLMFDIPQIIIQMCYLVFVNPEIFLASRVFFFL